MVQPFEQHGMMGFSTSDVSSVLHIKVICHRHLVLLWRLTTSQDFPRMQSWKLENVSSLEVAWTCRVQWFWCLGSSMVEGKHEDLKK
jgi:hypothetical protein